MLNPDKYIRLAYINTLESITGLPVVDISLAKDKAYPNSYIVLKNQSKQRTSVSKNCWEWRCQITIDIIFVNEKGFNSSVMVDDIEQLVISQIENGIIVPNFHVKSTELLNTSNLPVETPTQTISRKVVIYEHWLNKA